MNELEKLPESSTAQEPIGSGFGASSTADEVIAGIDLAGKVALVTGGYSGLGRETVRILVDAGAHVIVPVRDLVRGTNALKDIPGVEIQVMDLLDPISIDALANQFLASGRPLHLLVNSAGIMASPLVRDSRGYESHFATNHLGHFQLTARLWPALVKAKGARVISVSSMGHRYSPMNFEDPNFEHREYNRWAAYGQSKTANILFAVELDKRGQSHDVRSFSLHPGSIVGTGLEKHVSKEELIAGGVIDEHGNPILNPDRQLKTLSQGAATIIWCATSSRLNGMGGSYCENCDIAGIMPEIMGEKTMRDAERYKGVMPHAIDPEAAKRLWTLSETLTGIRFSAND